MVPYQVVNYINIFIFATLSLLAAIVLMGQWGKIKFSKFLIACLILTLVPIASGLVFSFLLQADVVSQGLGLLFWVNIVIAVALELVVVYFLAKNYLKIPANKLVGLASIYTVVYLLTAYFIGPKLFDILLATQLFKV